jgi:hypothetical protein
MISASEAARRRDRGAAALAEGNRDDLPELRVSVAGTFNLDLWPPCGGDGGGRHDVVEVPKANESRALQQKELAH